MVTVMMVDDYGDGEDNDSNGRLFTYGREDQDSKNDNDMKIP